jgi:hypothetical protein
VDFEKVYNIVPRKLLWPTIRKMGIPQEIVVVIQKMYVNNEAQVEIVNRITGFRTTKGLIQVSIKPNHISMGLPKKNQGIHHLFADDQVIIAKIEIMKNT